MPKGISKTYTSERRSQVTKKTWSKKGYRKKFLEGQQKTFQTAEYHEQQSKAQTARWSDPERRLAQSKALVSAWNEEGAKEVWSRGIKDSNDDELRAKKSTTRKKLMKDKSFASEQIAKTLSTKKKTKLELSMVGLLKSLELPYLFVGNGKLMIGRYCPDFVRVDCKAIIEMYGGYWHDRPWNKKHDKVRNAFIKSQGYKILIIKQKEMDDIDKVIRKIKRFDEKVMQELLYSGKTQTPVKKKKQVKV